MGGIRYRPLEGTEKGRGGMERTVVFRDKFVGAAAEI